MNICKNREKFAVQVVLMAGIYLAIQHIPLFCEYAYETSSGRGAAAEEKSDSAKEDWYVIDTDTFTIYCDRNSDLKNIARKLGRQSLFSSGVYNPNPASAPSEKVAYRLVRLMYRAQEILDMRPDMRQLKIKIFKDRDSLRGEYSKIFGKYGDYESFYVYKYDTIYISEETISDGVIAHEMGHAIADHYFAAVPPEKVGELLASYVDMHLEDDE